MNKKVAVSVVGSLVALGLVVPAFAQTVPAGAVSNQEIPAEVVDNTVKAEKPAAEKPAGDKKDIKKAHKHHHNKGAHKGTKAAGKHKKAAAETEKKTEAQANAASTY